MTSAPYEEKICLGIKVNSSEGATSQLFQNYNAGDELWVSEPSGDLPLYPNPVNSELLLLLQQALELPLF